MNEEVSIVRTPRFLTVNAAAKYCSLSTKSIHRLIGAGKLPEYRPIAGRILIDIKDLDDVVLNARPS